MRNKLVIFNTVIVTIALLLMFGLGMLVTYNNNYEQAEQKVVQLTSIYANNYSSAEAYSKKIDDNIRLTVIDATGTVIADSEQVNVSTLENHINREEIVAALNDSPKAVTRHSSTINSNMIYYAQKVNTEDSYVFVRVALPIDGVNSFVIKTIPLMLGILLAVAVISVLASYFLSNNLLKPLQQVTQGLQSVSNGGCAKILPTDKDSEINEMLSGINSISEKLSASIAEAREDSQKLDYILNNVSDGIVVFEADGKISLINTNAAEIFDIRNAVGLDVEALTSDTAFITAIKSAVVNADGSVFEFSVNSLAYLCAVKNTDSGMTIAVMSDITATKNNEKMKAQLFANASHELKTPLTSIAGFNDMIAIKSTQKDVLDYSSKIKRESDRMLTLIDDMLRLSKLENSRAEVKTSVAVDEVAAEVVDSLAILARNKNVSVTIDGNGTLLADWENVYELIKNLAENGIRYNNDGGEVKISIDQNEDKTIIRVSDNGIGIDGKHQSRIFERFYRVDKSRSRETGGTGLGLSIVKHIAELYNAKLTLTSKLGVGTTVTVVFPRP